MQKLVAGLALLSLGCVELGPEHLDQFYRQRDAFQGLIDKIEAQHGLASRDLARRADKAKELERRAKEAEEFRMWYATLTKEQQFQWALAQEEHAVSREWMRAEIQKAALTPAPVTNVSVTTKVSEYPYYYPYAFRSWP